MPRDRGKKLIAKNKRAFHDYFIDDIIEAGMVLSGSEVKSLRQGKASLIDSYASVQGGELWLFNAHISSFSQASWNNHVARRSRKLLVAKKDIVKFANYVQEQGRTIIPLSLYFKDGFAKVEIGLARGKNVFDKRHALKEKDAKREINNFK